MPASAPQTLASSRERRQPKLTARAQQILDQKKEKIVLGEEAKEKSKEKILSTRRANLINDKGDELMYKPVRRYVAPTITGDDDLDRGREEEAEAREILWLLAHRGDGDWTRHYQSGEVGLVLLRQARDNPGAKVIDQAIGDLALTSVKGKGKAKAIDSLDPDGSASGRNPTIYSGITIGRTPPESFTKQETDTRATPQLRYPSASLSAPAPKRPVAFHDNPAPSKKLRPIYQPPQRSSPQGGPTGRGAAPATVPGKSNPLPPKAPSGQVAFGSLGRSAIIPATRPSQDAVRPRPQDPQRPPQSRPSHDNRTLTVASPTAPPPTAAPLPVQPAWKRTVRENQWATWAPDEVPQPRKRVVTQPVIGLPPHRLANAADRLAARRAEHRARQPAAITKAEVAEARDGQPRVDQPRVDKPRIDKPRIDKPRLDKPRTDRLLPNKPRADERVGNPSTAGLKAPINPHSNKAHPIPPVRKGKAPAQRAPRPVGSPQHRPLDRTVRTPPEDEGARENEGDRREGRDRQDRRDRRDERDRHDDERRMDNNRHGPNQHGSIRTTVESFEPRERWVVKLMIQKAKPKIIAAGTFSWRASDPGEPVDNVDTIVARSFAKACNERGERLTLLTEHITCVKNLVTAYRTTVKEGVVLLVEKLIGFADANKDFNRELVEWLLPDAFHEADPDGAGDRQPFESDFFFKVVARTLFGPGKLGLKHAAQFTPVPIRFLAFLLAVCNHVIYCYRHGSFNQDEHLRSSVQQYTFHQYLELLSEMQEERPDALREICASMYDKARVAAGYDVIPRIDRPRRQWAPDIAEPYVPQFVAPAEDFGDSTDQDDNGSVDGDGRGYDLVAEGMSYGSARDGGRRALGDRVTEERDDDNYGAGPSKPYGVESDDASEAKGWPEAEYDELEPSDNEMDE